MIAGTKHLAAGSTFDGLEFSTAMHQSLGDSVRDPHWRLLRGGRIFGIVLIFLHQPYRSSNPGLAAYKPPPGTAIKHYLLPSRPESRDVFVALPAPATEPETTGRSLEQADARQDSQSMPEPERRPNPTLTRKPKPPKELRRETAAQMSAPQPTPCIPGYDGSGAQTRWC
jgi:hypothetical protein